MYSRKLGFIDNKLVYICVSAKFKGLKNLKQEDAVLFYHRVEKIINDFNKDSKPSFNKGF